MPWLCGCGSNNANLNSSCAICKSLRIGDLECFDDSEYLQIKVICYLTRSKEYNMPMTESERLFAKFFAEEKVLVADMDDLTLRSHREELSKIAFEARARLTAIGDEVQGRTSKKNKVFNSPSEESVGDTINKINERKTKMSKVDKQIDNLVAMGIDRAVAEKMFAGATITATKAGQSKEVGKELDKKPAQSKGVNNPFLVLTETKEPIAENIETQIQLAAIIEQRELDKEIVELVKETIEEGIKETPGNIASFNPFAKK